MNNSFLWHNKPLSDIYRRLKTREHGLTEEEAKKILDEKGMNKLPEGKVDPLWLIFFRQFQSPLIYILLISSGIVYAMGEKKDSVIILIVLLFNAIVGTIQEGRAQNTLLALKKFVETRAVVVRDGKELIIKPCSVIVLREP